MAMTTTDLAVFERIEAIKPSDIFRPDYFDPYLAAIREHVISKAATLDISTPSNRSDLAALAYKVGRSKTFIDGQRKSLVSDEKKRLAKIDSEGKRIWEILEALQHEVRKPLTDWENAEKQRVANHEANLKELENSGPYTTQNWQSLSVGAMQDRLSEIENDPTDWQEFHARATLATKNAIQEIRGAIAQRKKYDDEQSELARLRAESAAREQKEREELIAHEATERANAEARKREEQASREVQESVARHQREKEEAEARALKAKQDHDEAIAIAERKAREAAEQAGRDLAAAVAAEQKRVSDAKSVELAEQAAREKDKAHKSDIHSTALAAFVSLGLSDEDAKKVVTAIAKGLIPSVKVVY